MLTRAGANVVVLEAGGPWDNATDSAMMKWPYETQRRGASNRERPFGEFDACIGGWELQGEPFTRAEGTRFDWWRARMVGAPPTTGPHLAPLRSRRLPPWRARHPLAQLADHL